MKKIVLNYLFLIPFLTSCNNTPQIKDAHTATEPPADRAREKHFKGAFSNGMKGDSIFFTVSADQKKITDLTFKGYWRCSGKLEILRAAGPEGSFPLINGKVNSFISEPPGGGSTAWRFELNASVNNTTASGTFRMNINALGCDSYLLKFTATAK